MKVSFKKFNKSGKGFTLVETLVAISIFTVSLLGIMSLLASNIANTTYAKQKMIASYLAQEGIEYIRNIRDTHVIYSGATWLNLKNSILGHCGNHGTGAGSNDKNCYIDEGGIDFGVDDKPIISIMVIKQCGSPPSYICPVMTYDTNTGKYGYNSSTNSPFTRTIYLKYLPSVQEYFQVFSTVSWTQGSGSYSITFSEDLYDWTE
jgi:prepilin-type N-terminal cleavage/methylation domain-containing protein